jgi:hypothetical protein
VIFLWAPKKYDFAFARLAQPRLFAFPCLLCILRYSLIVVPLVLAGTHGNPNPMYMLCSLVHDTPPYNVFKYVVLVPQDSTRYPGTGTPFIHTVRETWYMTPGTEYGVPGSYHSNEKCSRLARKVSRSSQCIQDKRPTKVGKAKKVAGVVLLHVFVEFCLVVNSPL